MYEPFSQIFAKYSFFPAAALGAATAWAWIKRGNASHTLSSWRWYIPFACILALTYYACYQIEKNNRDTTALDIRLGIAPSIHKLDEITVIYRNRSTSDVLVFNTFYRANGADSFINNKVPVVLTSGAERSATLGEIIDPASQRTAILNIKFRFADGFFSSDFERILKCEFSLSPSMAGSKQLSPENCEEVSENTILPQGGEQMVQLFTQPIGAFDVKIKEDFDAGRYFQVGSNPGWVFTYEPSKKKASLGRGLPGNQIGVDMDVKDTPDRKHRFEGSWSNKTRSVYLIVDGEGKAFRIPDDVWDRFAAEKPN